MGLGVMSVMALAVLEEWLDLVTLEGFSNLNDSVIYQDQ